MSGEGRQRDEAAAISDGARGDRAQAEREVAERHHEKRSPEPHHELANPAHDPDPSEYPDPYERREDPRDPDRVDTPAKPAGGEAGGEQSVPQGRSTSDPPPPRNIDRVRGGEGAER